MKTRKLILAIAASLAAAVSFSASAQTPQKATIDGKWNLETVGSPVGDVKFSMTITKTENGYTANIPGYSISDVQITDTDFMCLTSAMGMTVQVDLFLTDKGTLEGGAMGVSIVGTKEQPTIEGSWDLTTVGSPVGEIKFTLNITKTEDGYTATMPGYPIQNPKITDNSFSCTTSNAGMTVDMDLYLTDKGTLEGGAMGISIVGNKK